MTTEYYAAYTIGYHDALITKGHTIPKHMLRDVQTSRDVVLGLAGGKRVWNMEENARRLMKRTKEKA